MSFSAHGQEVYLNYLKKEPEPAFSSFKTWEARNLTLSATQLQTIGKLFGVCCPVDVLITDDGGKPVASVIGGVANYYDSIFGEVMTGSDVLPILKMLLCSPIQFQPVGRPVATSGQAKLYPYTFSWATPALNNLTSSKFAAAAPRLWPVTTKIVLDKLLSLRNWQKDDVRWEKSRSCYNKGLLIQPGLVK